MVVIDPIKCTGCRDCVDACPCDAIYFNEDLNLAQKCTGCAHLLDDGWTEPRCVDACPTEAMKFGEEAEMKAWMDNAKVLHPGTDTQPRVYYHNIPKKFVGGTVYDPKAKEVIIGAACTLDESGSGETLTTTTDEFGDFWFEGLETGTFSLKIESDGKSKTIDAIVTEKDVNLGDIPFP